jgi:hypothetical protein
LKKPVESFGGLAFIVVGVILRARKNALRVRTNYGPIQHSVPKVTDLETIEIDNC